MTICAMPIVGTAVARGVRRSLSVSLAYIWDACHRFNFDIHARSAINRRMAEDQRHRAPGRRLALDETAIDAFELREVFHAVQVHRHLEHVLKVRARCVQDRLWFSKTCPV